MLEINEVNKKFGKRVALDDINLKLEKQVYGLVGPNGAGKTTLMRCLTGLYPKISGSISLDGKWTVQQNAYKNRIGYLPQKFALFRDMKVKDALLYLAALRGMSKPEAKQKIEECLKTVNLSDRINSKIRTLSGGMLRRVGIAQALLGNPDIIIFDEPTSGLDPEERLRFKMIVNTIRNDKTILISTHILNDVEAVCDKIIVMNEGKVLAEGNKDFIKNHAAGKVYTTPASVRETDIIKVVGCAEEDGKMISRVISSQPFKGEAIDPEVEDGYLCILKNI